MDKNIDYYMALPYQETIEADPAGGYVGYVKELKGCITQGETKLEVLEQLEDAKRCWLAVAMEEEMIIPEPDDAAYSGKFNIRIPKSLHRRLAQKAQDEGVSLNQLATYLLSSGLGYSPELLVMEKKAAYKVKKHKK